jgi:hypothetical protein
MLKAVSALRTAKGAKPNGILELRITALIIALYRDLSMARLGSQNAP